MPDIYARLEFTFLVSPFRWFFSWHCPGNLHNDHVQVGVILIVKL
jgi:hypothetical protein